MSHAVARLASSVTGYLVHLRRMAPPATTGPTPPAQPTRSTGEAIWRTDRTDFVLEGLRPDSSYEVSRVPLPGLPFDAVWQHWRERERERERT